MTPDRRAFMGLLAGAAFTAVAKPAQASGHTLYSGYASVLDAAIEYDANYVLAYDTHHQNRAVPAYSMEEGALDLAQARGFRHICLEIPREYQSVLDDRAQGRLNHEQFKIAMGAHLSLYRYEDKSLADPASIMSAAVKGVVQVRDPAGTSEYIERLSAGLVAAQARGIKIWAVDSNAFADAANRINGVHDVAIANYIAEVTKGELAVITYGAAHGAWQAPVDGVGGGLDDELSRRGRVVLVELSDGQQALGGPKTRAFFKTLWEKDLRAAADRTPLRLDIRTGKLNSLGGTGIAFVRGKELPKKGVMTSVTGFVAKFW